MSKEFNDTQTSLVGMAFDDYMQCLVGSTLARGNSAPKDAVRSLLQLITTIAGAGLNDEARAVVVNHLRDAADEIEAPLIKKRMPS